MGNIYSKWLQVGTIIISLLALIISGASLFYTISDHSELLDYELRNCELIITFDRKEVDEKGTWSPAIYFRNDIYLYNNSNLNVTIKNVEKFYENEEGLIFIEDVSPMKFFNNVTLKPGDYVYHAELDFNVAEDPKRVGKYRSTVIGKINEYFVNNPKKAEDRQEFLDNYYTIDGLSEYVLPLINRYTSDKQYKRIVYKITTSRNTSIWMRFNYLDDIIDSAN